MDEKNSEQTQENTQEEKEKKPDLPNTKTVPIIIILAAAFISCVVSIFQHATFETFTFRLLITVTVFMVIGVIVKMVLDYAFKTMDEIKPIDGDIEIPEVGDAQEDIDALNDDSKSE